MYPVTHHRVRHFTLCFPTIHAAMGEEGMKKLGELESSAIEFTQTNLFQFTGNFRNWTNVLTNVLATNSFIFSDRTASNSGFRFYRVLETP